jgi:hypothetical protein
MRTPKKWNACSIVVWNSPAPHERKGIAGGLPAPLETEQCHLLSQRLDGQQLLGYSAHTHDLDFVIQLPSSAVPTIIREFKDDFYIDETAVRAARQPPYQFNAIDTRSALKVDFWLPKPEPFDREMFRRRKEITLFGEPAWITTAEDVILHKLIWNRIIPKCVQFATNSLHPVPLPIRWGEGVRRTGEGHSYRTESKSVSVYPTVNLATRRAWWLYKPKRWIKII